MKSLGFSVVVFTVMFCFLQIGVWNSQTGLNLTEANKDSPTNVTDSMANRTLIVTTILVCKELVSIRQQLIGKIFVKLFKCNLYSAGKSLCHV